MGVRVGMSDERFQVVVHHGGTLIKDVSFKYIGGEITYWEVDPDKWCYFGIVGSLKHMGYMEVAELYYSVQHVLHKLYDDKGAMNMLNVARYLDKVNLYVVHGVDNPEIVENDVNDVMYLCEGPTDSGEGSGVGDEEVEQHKGTDDGLDVDNEGGAEVHSDGVKAPLVVENECEGGDEVEKEEVAVGNEDVGVEAALEVENEGGAEVENEGGADVQNEAALEVQNDEEEEEVEIDKEAAHSDEEEVVETDEEVEVESEDEPGIEDLSGDEYVEEGSDAEAQLIGRGLSDGE
ncbi:acidic leucine-rich nuclear phosphoprotein 32-related protein 1-like [Vigna radiata var. radiata]|uniref:Acidic leucine-rich nuclear phosphoprotein 32-related protein 1-like n=1 Tax=Vigna radiata var. radiata TaxID=3916 RepID=A0A1S3UK86_VIGRR|nr:acidic leucine-rich nuclear phosphoprotein 32-related protein 1-like [Vigna radiata var. radiata]